MEFVQVIKMSTSKYAELDAAHEEWLAATEGVRTVQREMVLVNRDKPGEYWIIVEFPSHDDAMKNNELPATATIAEKMGRLAEGEPEFVNLDVVRRD
jgi:hypothetical protein